MDGRNMAASDSCVERVIAAIGVGGMVGAVAGMGRAAFATPAALERAMIVGTEAAKKEMPQVAKMVASNAVLFSSVGFAYAGGKCLCEGLYGEPHPLNSGVGGALAGAAMGMHRGSPTAMLGLGAGCFVVAIIGDINGPRFVQDPDRLKKKWNDYRMAPEK